MLGLQTEAAFGRRSAQKVEKEVALCGFFDDCLSPFASFCPCEHSKQAGTIHEVHLKKGVQKIERRHAMTLTHCLHQIIL